MRTTGYAAYSPSSPLALFQFERRSLRPNDVAIEILYSGVCHSDLHTARNNWDWKYYPIVPDHEIVGRVTAVGADVSRYRVGDHVGVIGLGGMGHMAVKLAVGLGADVTVLSRTAFERMERADVRYRFVIDMASLRAEAA